MTATLVHSHRAPTSGVRLGVLAKRSYRIEPGGVATPLDEAPAILTTPRFEGDDPDARMLLDSDVFCFEKPLTDVLLLGSARSVRGAVTQLDTHVRVGRAQKSVRAHGDRRVITGASGLELGPAEPFTEVPLDWTRAYGGIDGYGAKARAGFGPARGVEDLGLFGYPRNPWGRGFYEDVDRERTVGELAPNLEDPEDPVRAERLFARDALDWVDRPLAAAYAPVDFMSVPRAMFLPIRHDWSPPARPMRELALGAVLEKDLEDPPLGGPPDARAFQCAPAGLAVARLVGGEPVLLVGLHPKHERLEFRLPREAPRLYVEPPNVPARELPAALATVLIEPDQDRVTLTWAGSIPAGGIFPPDMCREMRHAAVF